MIPIALGTVSPVRGANFVAGNKRVRVVDVQITSGANYTTGGETLTAAQLGLRSRIDQVNVLSQARNAAGTASVPLTVDYTNAPASVKLQAYFSSTGAADAEVAASTNLSSYSVRLVVTGA